MVAGGGRNREDAAALDSALGHPWHPSEGLAALLFPATHWERILGCPSTTIWAGCWLWGGTGREFRPLGCSCS